MINIARRLLIGKPLHNKEMMHERLPKWKALSIFSSDALSSVAYGPEQALLVLVAAQGIIAYGYLSPIIIAVSILLIIVALSYVQVSRANPGGGGAYAVAKKNIGELPALVAAGAVFADYVLTAAVSVAAGTAAIVSAFPSLAGREVGIDLGILFFILMLVNLRGMRESSNMFVYPTYAFLLGMVALIVTGMYQAITQDGALLPAASLEKQPLNMAMLYIVLRAFANGCSSMTGVEAIADSVPLFEKPEAKNAIITTYWMAGILVVMLSGVTFMMMHFHVIPILEVTALSQLAEHVFGRSFVYYYIQVTTMIVLYLAANTAYNGLPVLLSIVARDGYLPRYLSSRGERLTFSNGIIVITVSAAALIVVFGGHLDHLIALYAIGVFISFTIAQCSMVVHWKREKGSGWLIRAVVNGIGAIATGLVVIIITLTKFSHGAWAVLVFIPVMVFVFKKIRSHYDDMAEQLHLPLEENVQYDDTLMVRNYVIVPISSPTRVVYESLKFAKTLSKDIIVLHIAKDEESAAKVQMKWDQWNPGMDLEIIQSPYRLTIQPLLDYVEALKKRKNPQDYITVVIPEFETRKWWHRLLHNQTGWLLHAMLVIKENVSVTTIPYHLNK
ncbi:APC family permease [Pelosinus fermentans]|uniref:Amino acid transporter n=1 Tax=Pelosinus fermentans B4 TaxID=1149862 RepID=I8RMW8_9FIRM|nr:APC family permease [Pelosinus fermentans]EIW20280.1 amino acid transporter [Pelosinus fermentans B4]EIW25882.1 amino acid transporter [Pelosinus fermentans A11]OAM93180.1 PotE, amino acid transporter [Pelosinus fermentans DSM 17108]SDQ69508.1 Amino acid transporter [Pelosinus fermentans]